MKYIRTKDGIYEVKCETDITYELNTQSMLYRVYKSEVIKQADTIEELCDEFVLGKTKCHKPCVAKLPLDFLKECVIAKTLYDLVVYGSIWVNDELRKVAKMNDKGELELL